MARTRFKNASEVKNKENVISFNNISKTTKWAKMDWTKILERIEAVFQAWAFLFKKVTV